MKLYLANTLNNLDYTSTYTQLKEDLELILTDYLKATIDKDFNTKKRYPKELALTNFHFLDYNRMGLHALIFDLDYKITNQGLYKKIMSKIKVEPTWILQTDKGAQVGFILKRNVIYEKDEKKKIKPTKALDKAKEIKKRVTELLGGDDKGSNRLWGFWRNPLMHDYMYIGNKCEFSDFYPIMNNYKKSRSVNQQFKADVVKRQIKERRFKYKLGSRNDYLFRSIMRMSKNQEWGKNENTVYHFLVKLNKEESRKANIEELPDNELRNTAKQVAIYNRENKNFFGVYKPKKNINIKRGAMGFNPIAKDGYVDEITHDIETTYRQIKSAERTNEILSEKEAKGEVEMTRAERAISNAKARAEKARKTVLNTITGLFADEYKKKSGSWHIGKISKKTGVSRNVVAKYIKEYEAELQKRATKE